MPADQRMRQTNTFSSSVFGGPTSSNYEDSGLKVKGILDNMGPDHTQRGRDQNTFNSQVFGTPIQNPTNRKNLGFGHDAGKDNLLGPEK